jgi:hypothetical protein
MDQLRVTAPATSLTSCAPRPDDVRHVHQLPRASYDPSPDDERCWDAQHAVHLHRAHLDAHRDSVLQTAYPKP